VKILSIVPFPPRLDATHGGGKATANLLLSLAERHALALVYLRRPSDPAADPALVECCDLVEAFVPADVNPSSRLRRLRKALLLVRGNPLWATDVDAPALAATVARVASRWQPDVVQVDYAVMTEAASLLPPAIPLVLVDHEPGTARAESELRTAGHSRFGSLLRRADVAAWRRFDRRVAKRASTIVVFTDRDRAAVARVAPNADVRVIPIGVAPPSEPLDPTGSEEAIVFVGSFVHAPNVDAALVLIREIFPRLRARHPGLTVYVVGEQPPAELLALEGDGVVVTGRVPDVQPYLDRAAVAVAPLRQGGGMRMKVLETLAAGKALVATPLAVAGLDVRDGDHVLLAEGPAAFADAVSRLLDHPQARAELGRQARAWALEQPDWDAVATRYEHLYDSLVGR
jgi:glycosyltransferase involved in cell wall biosynthesis